MKLILFAIFLLLSMPALNLLGQESGNSKTRTQSDETVRGLEDNKKQGAEPLTNDSILKLVAAGLGEDTIVRIVESQAGEYSLGADNIIALKKAGVSEKIITAM